MTSLPLPLPQSAVPTLPPPPALQLRKVSLCAVVSQSAALLAWLQQAGGLGKMCKVRNFRDPL